MSEELKLLFAVETNDVSLVKDIIDSKIDVNKILLHDDTIIFTAVRYDYPEIVKLLIDAKARVDFLTPKGQSLLMYSQSDEMTRILIEAKVDVNIQDVYGNTALNLIAPNTSTINSVVQLIEAKADVNLPNKIGITPLMNSVEIYHPDYSIVKILIENKADLDATDARGKTFLDYVINPTIAKYISNEVITKKLTEKRESGEHVFPFPTVSGGHHLLFNLIANYVFGIEPMYDSGYETEEIE